MTKSLQEDGTDEIYFIRARVTAARDRTSVFTVGFIRHFTVSRILRIPALTEELLLMES